MQAKIFSRIGTKVIWPVVITVILLAFVANQVLLAIAEGADGLPNVGLRIGIRISGLVFGILGGLALILGTIQAMRWVISNFGKLFHLEIEEKEPPSKEELGPVLAPYTERVDEEMAKLKRELGRIQERRADARVHLTDVNMKAITLVGLIQAVAAKAAFMMHERRVMIDIRQALKEGDGQALAELAGELGDASLTRLLLDSNVDRYQEKLLTMLSTEIGSLQGMSDSLVRLARLWVDQLGQFRQEMDRIALVVDTAEALPVVTEIQFQLTAAQQILGMDQSQIESMVVSRQLPAMLEVEVEA